MLILTRLALVEADVLADVLHLLKPMCLLILALVEADCLLMCFALVDADDSELTCLLIELTYLLMLIDEAEVLADVLALVADSDATC